MAQKKNIFERGPDVTRDALEPRQIRPLEGLSTVQEKEAASWLPGLIEGHREHGAEVELVLRGSWEARKRLKRAAVTTVPAEAAASAFEAVPADGGVHVVEQEPVGAG